MNQSLAIFYGAKNREAGCLFCKPIEGMVVAETAHFNLLMDTIPIMPGHLLLSTKQHYGCCGEVPPEWMQELDYLKNKMGDLALQIGGHACFYEHGRAGGCSFIRPGFQCEHFHLHCLPASVDIHPFLEELYPSFEMGRQEHISELFLEHGDYLFFQNSQGKMKFYIPGERKVAPHLLRTLICTSILSPHLADWESVNDPKIFVQSYELVMTALTTHYGEMALA